ncbi:MAG: DUF5615 family PIN-like protein [Deltaproteobacteria bacterium]|nr:DUF5615 family PIN-like protein [Deltaproteobacteria bacterium]
MIIHFKLDENADRRWFSSLEKAGHRISTVVEEGFAGADDAVVAATCKRMELCLVTADLGFAQIFQYRPSEYHGIIVLRHPKPSLQGMSHLVSQIVGALRIESPVGRLWIVEPGRMRVYGQARSDRVQS